MTTIPQGYELWLSQLDRDVVTTGRVVCWQPVTDRPVPVVAWTDAAGELIDVGPPVSGRVFLGATREAAVEAARVREPGTEPPQVR